MENKIFEDLELAVFTEQTRNIKDYDGLIKKVEHLKKNIHFKSLLYIAIHSYMKRVELLELQYSNYIETKQAIMYNVDLIRNFIKEYDSRPKKHVINMNMKEFEDRNKYKQYKRNVDFLEHMSNLYTCDDREFYHEIAEQLKQYDDLVYYILEHKENYQTDKDIAEIIELLKKEFDSKHMKNQVFESIYKKYIITLEYRILYENLEEKLSDFKKNKIERRRM